MLSGAKQGVWDGPSTRLTIRREVGANKSIKEAFRDVGAPVKAPESRRLLAAEPSWVCWRGRIERDAGLADMMG